MAADLSTLTVSLCVTQFHCLSYSLMVGSLFFMVLQILIGFFPKLTVFKKTPKKTKQTQAAHSIAADIEVLKQFSIYTVDFCLHRNFSAFFFLIGIHPMQGWTATTRHGVARKKAQKRLQGTENLLRKNLQLKDVC